MSDLSQGSLDERSLCARPNLEHLKRTAKQRLEALRRTAPDAKLADAQFHLARDYGFSSWRALKADVDRRVSGGGPTAGRHDRYLGWYRHDPQLISHGVLTVTEDGQGLLAQLADGPTLRLEGDSEGEGVFTVRGLPDRYEFLGAGSARASALVIRGELGSLRLARTDEGDARAALAAVIAARAEQTRPRTAIEVAPGVLARWVGWYSTPVGPAIEITRDGARLFARVSGQQKVEVFPETDARFFYRIMPVQLTFLPQGAQGIALILHQNGQQQRLPRVPEAAARAAGAPFEQKAQAQQRPRTTIQVDGATLAGYVGRYRLDARRMLTVTAEDARLFIEITDQERYEVYAESPHQFFWTVVAAQISFITDTQGQATVAIIHQFGHDLPLSRIDTRPASAGSPP